MMNDDPIKSSFTIARYFNVNTPHSMFCIDNCFAEKAKRSRFMSGFAVVILVLVVAFLTRFVDTSKHDPWWCTNSFDNRALHYK